MYFIHILRNRDLLNTKNAINLSMQSRDQVLYMLAFVDPW